jgi:hypothetical protein
MQNETLSQSDNRPAAANSGANQDQTDQKWSELQQDLDALGRQLAQLRGHTAALGEQLVADLEAHYQEVKGRAIGFRQATERQLDAMRESAWRQAGEAQGAFSDARTRSTEAAREAARQVWEKSEPLRQGARDVGEGLGRAWSELVASFGKAAGRLHTDSPPVNGPAQSSGDDPHKTT